MGSAFLGHCVAHSLTHGIHIGAMDVSEAPVLSVVMLLSKLGMKTVAKRWSLLRRKPFSRDRKTQNMR